MHCTTGWHIDSHHGLPEDFHATPDAGVNFKTSNLSGNTRVMLVLTILGRSTQMYYAWFL